MKVRILSVFLALVSAPVLADPDQSRLSLERVHASVGVGTGWSIPSTSLKSWAGFLEPSVGPYADFLEALDLQHTENVVTASANVAYSATDRLSFGLTLPVGMVQRPASSTLPGLFEEEFGPGDPYVSVDYLLLEESASRPALSVSAGWDGAVAEYISLGDGQTSFDVGLSAKKYISDDNYLFGGFSVTARQGDGIVGSSNVYTAHIGTGLLVASGRARIDTALSYSQADDVDVGDASLPGGGNLSLRVSTRSASERFGLDFYIANLEELDLTATTFGMRLTTRVMPW